MEANTVQKVIDTSFSLPQPAVRGSNCRVRIFSKSSTPTIVVISQIPGSRGTSISNLFEEIATEVQCRHLEYFTSIPVAPIWVQHYPAGSLHLETEERLHLVTFDQNNSGRFSRPRWTHVDEAHPEAQCLHQLLLL